MIELTKECSQMRNEGAAHMTQSWWKQISQMNTCQWYSPSSWPDSSDFVLFGNISVFLQTWSPRSVQLVPGHELAPSCQDLSKVWWAQQGHPAPANITHIVPIFSHPHKPSPNSSATHGAREGQLGLSHPIHVETNRNPHVSYQESSLHEGKAILRVSFETPATEGKEQNPIIAITEMS